MRMLEVFLFLNKLQPPALCVVRAVFIQCLNVWFWFVVKFLPQHRLCILSSVVQERPSWNTPGALFTILSGEEAHLGGHSVHCLLCPSSRVCFVQKLWAVRQTSAWGWGQNFVEYVLLTNILNMWACMLFQHIETAGAGDGVFYKQERFSDHSMSGMSYQTVAWAMSVSYSIKKSEDFQNPTC